MHKKLQARSYDDAIRQAKSLCRCNRMSFDGVKWFDAEAQLWREIDWQTVDTTRPARRPPSSQKQPSMS